MDLDDQNSALKSARHNEAMTTPQSKIGSNGSGTPVGNNNNNNKLDDVKGKGIEINGPVDNSPPLVKSTPTSKGFGLKKWKRIKRGAHKDYWDSSSINSDKLLKRGLANPVANSAKPVHFSAGSIQRSDGSVSSTNAVFRSPGVLVDGFGVIGDLTFNAVSESENSEDRSSKSSTAASAPNARFEAPVVLGYSSDMHQLRSLSGKNLGTSAQQAHQGKGRAETSKKPRGERVKVEKENSHSSMESDSRNSNFLFMQGSDYVTSNGTKCERSMNDGEFSDETQDRERPIGEELHAGCERGNDRESENVSQEDLVAESPQEVKEEKSENQGSFTDHDPLMESIFNLQTAQEALERELQKFKEIGKDVIFGHSLEDVGIPSDFTSDLPGPSTSEQSQHRDGARHSSNSLGSEVVSLKQNIILLQSKLQKAADRVKSKEARVTELEAILGSSSKKEEKTIDTMHQSSRDMESELEGLFRQKIEAEVQYLAISRTAQKLKAAAVDQATLLEEQKILASEQAQMVHRLGDAETKAAMLKTQAEKLESYWEDIATTDEKLKLQKNVYKYSSCFLIQLVLLAVVVGLFLMQTSPNYAEVVPT
ncbi:WPP domain-interacting protein 2 [Nicotiana tabacum]|uniref:WPP domain-interacting protein 2 n=2 Tax=Nicotiana TaxID=4085 RepID=A0A1S4AY90_TOBAC|nr:PREDICTED: WPP domain-interacting protein 2 [Nicotiana sylvestris]XP_009797502.1 PREDICTED: WPP domain-interacting protein 2 [Nicotiana sylvestris]XP_016481646.1 PREDICTED: WPP domain-interacting protein 2-like [Nicotiana tabacum]XP_016481647.1 PREDICTED: WPP domain-interacting protein 2-like [Nicotiana tabacum]